MIGLTELVLVLLAGGALWRSARPLMERKLSLADRALALEEATVSARTAGPAQAEKMPADLALYTVSAAEEWARDEATSYVWQLYRQHGDWGVVRQVINGEEATRREQAEAELSQIAVSGMVQ